MKYLLHILFAGALFGQTAPFPTALAADQDLKVAKDRSSSTLSSGITNSTLSVAVASGAAFVAYELITIDNEQMLICSIASNTLTICTGTRGYAGTSAASHSNGAAVLGNVTAYHHNALRVEVKAIESALGLNPNAVNAVSFSATPTFDLSLGHVQKITLTGNVTSSTFSNATAGAFYTFYICQDSTGTRTFVWPTAVKGGMIIGSTLNTCNSQQFQATDASTLYATSPGVQNQ